MPEPLSRLPRPLCALLLAASALVTGAPAQAQLTLDGTFRAEVAHNRDTSVNTKRFRGSFAGKVHDDIGVQIDLGIGKHERYTSTSPSATLHLYDAPDDALAYGVFLAAEDRRPGNSYFWGAEIAYRPGPFGIEAFAAWRDDISASSTGTRVGLDVSYVPDTAPRWTFQAGGVSDQGDPFERSYGYVAAGYAVHDGIELGMTLARNDEAQTIAGARVTFTFGDGAPFRARDTMELYPGD